MVAKNDISALVSSAGLIVVGVALNSAVSLFERVIIGRTLSPTAYGQIDLGLALMTLTVTVSLIGFEEGIPRYMSRFDQTKDIRGAWLTGLVCAGVTSLLIAGLLYMNIERIGVIFYGSTGSTRLLRLFVLTIPLVVGLRIGIGAIRGLENTRYRTYARDVVFPGSRLIFLIIFLYIGLDVLAAGYAYIIGAALAFCVAHLLFNRLLPINGEFRTHVSEMMRFSAPLVVSTVLAILLTRTDTLMIGYFRSSYEVGLYAAAYPLAGSLLIVLSSFGFLYLPIASRLDSSDEREEINVVYQLTTKWIYIATFPAFLTLLVFPENILTLVWGSRYIDAAFALSILSIGFFTSAAAGRNRETLSALGHTGYLLFASSLAFIVNVGLNLVLIPSEGFVGAAAASAFSFVVLNIVVYFILKAKFNISPFCQCSIRTFVYLPLCLLPIFLILSRSVSITPLLIPVVFLLAAVLSVVVVCVTGCLQSEDEILLEHIEKIVPIRMGFVRRYIPE